MMCHAVKHTSMLHFFCNKTDFAPAHDNFLAAKDKHLDPNPCSEHQMCINHVVDRFASYLGPDIVMSRGFVGKANCLKPDGREV